MKKSLDHTERNRKIIAGLLVAAVILTAVIVVSVRHRNKLRQEEERVNRGIEYLTELEEQDMQGISEDIKTIRDERVMNLADSDESSIWREFDGALILGDSRAVGFSYYELLPQEQVLAQSGERITDIDAEIEQIKELAPDRIFLCFGLNDVGTGVWPSKEEYAAACDERIQLLQREVPDAQVYLNSILPVTGAGLGQDPNYQRIGEFNESLQTMCAEKGYHYIDNTEMANAHLDLYQEDGLHVGKEFYKYWAANMLTEVE